MEGLFGIFVGIVFLVITILNSSQKLSKESGDKTEKQEIDRKIDELVKESEGAGQEGPETLLTSEDKTNQLETEKTTARKPIQNQDKNTLQKKKQGEKKRNGEIRPGDFQQGGLIKGIVMKEILDKPRSKRPYRFYKY